MENELLIKAIMIRWYHNIQNKTIKSKFNPRTARNFLADDYDIVVPKDEYDSFEKLLMDVANEYDSMESIDEIEERYPQSIITGEQEQQTEPEVEQLAEEVEKMDLDEDKEISREDFEKIMLDVYEKMFRDEGYQESDITWSMIKEKYLQNYPYILNNSSKYLKYFKHWDQTNKEMNDLVADWKDEYKLKHSQKAEEQETREWSKKMVRNEEGKLRISSKPPQDEKQEEKEQEQAFDQVLKELESESGSEGSEGDDKMVDTAEVEQLMEELSVDKDKKARSSKKRKVVGGVRMDMLIKEVKKEIEARKKAKEELISEYDTEEDQIPREARMTTDIKTYLPYYALLTYYITDKSIPVTDPFLVSFFSNFPDVDDAFINSFKDLNAVERIEVISNYFNNTPMKNIFVNLSSNQLVQPVPINSFLAPYIGARDASRCQDIQRDVAEDLLYNTMFYMMSVGDIDDSEFPDTISSRLLAEFTVLLKQRIKCNDDFSEQVVEYIQNFISNLTSNVKTKSELLEKAKVEQLQRITELFQNNFSVYSEDIDSAQQLIQDMYIEAYPHIIDNIKDVYKGEIPSSKSLLFMYVPDEARSELNMMSSQFDNPIFREKITKIVEVLKDKFKEETEQVDRIKTMLKKKQIDEFDSQFLLTFIKFYGSLAHFPTERNNSMLSLNNIENYPQYIQTVIQTKLRNTAALAEQQIKQSALIRSEQQSLLLRLQVELNKAKQFIDSNKIVNIINELDLDSATKSRFLRLVREGEFKNVYLLLKSADVKTKTLLNPLVYTGRKRSERLQKLQESQSYSEKITKTLPNVSGPLRECILQQFLAPWKKIDYTKSDNKEFHWISKEKRPHILQREVGFSYFIADPYLSKEELSDEQRLFFGARIPIPEFSISIAKDYGHTWSRDTERLGQFKETVVSTEPMTSNIPLSDRVYSIALVYLYEHPSMTATDKLKYDFYAKRLLKDEYHERSSFNALNTVMQRFKNRQPDNDVYQHAKDITQSMVRTVQITDNREVLHPIYTPTTYFWKIYCSGHATFENGLIILRYNKDGEDHEQSFSMGILYKNPHYKSLHSEEWITEVITQRDFNQEQEWMKEKASIKTTFYKFCRTVLFEIKSVRESARTKAIELINRVLTQFYKNTNTKELVISFQSRRLEEAIYNSVDVITLYDYFRMIHTVLFFLNPENPSFNSLQYYRYLFSNTNPGNYESVLFNRFDQYAPELYLLSQKDKEEIESAFGFFIESATLNDCKFLYNIADVSRSRTHIEHNYYTSALLSVVKEKTQKIFQHVDASLLKNICVNHEMVEGQPSIVIESDQQLYCFDNPQVEQILANTFSYELPEDVKNQLRRTFTVDSLKHADKLSAMKEEANIYVGRYLSELIQDWNIHFIDKDGKYKYEKPFKQVSDMSDIALNHLDKVIDNIELFELGSIVTDVEKELILQHMLDQIKVEYFSRIDNLVFTYLDQHPSVGDNIRRLNEQVDTHNEANILKQQEGVLSGLFQYINSDLHIILPKSIEKYILNYVSSKYKPILTQKESRIYKCHSCAKEVETPLWKTYYTEVSTTFCSRSCLSKVDDDAMMKDRSEDIKEQLIKSLVWPYLQPRLVVDKIPQVNPNDIMSVAEGYGIDPVPNVFSSTTYILSGNKKDEKDDQVIELKQDPQTYDNLYGNILRLPQFVLPNTILRERQGVLMQLAKLFRVRVESDKMEDDDKLRSVFIALRKNKDFEKLYQLIAGTYISERINTHMERLVIDLVEKNSSKALRELADIFGIKQHYNKDQIIEELDKIDEVKSAVRQYKKSSKLMDYGVHLSRTSEQDDKTPFGAIVANEFKNRLNQFSFGKDLFEPYMRTAKINYDDIRQFLKDYESIKRDTMIIDSLGQAFREVRSNTPDMNVVFDVMNINYKVRLEKERETNPVVAKKFAEWSIPVINADMINEIGRRIGFGTLQNFGEASIEFINSSFDSFSDFIFRKHHFITRQIQHVNDVISDLREIRDAFIRQTIRLNYMEHNQKMLDESLSVEPRLRQKYPQVNLPPSRRTLDTTKTVKAVPKSTTSSVIYRKDARKQALSKPKTETVIEKQDIAKEMKLLSEDLTRHSEKVLRDMFSPLYVSPFRQTVREDMKVKVVDTSDTFRQYINQEGKIYTVRTKTDDKYIVQMNDGKLIPLTRKQFEILESGEFVEEEIQQPSEDAIVDEEIAEQVIDEFGDEKDVIEKDAEEIIDVNEEEQDEPEDVEYGEEMEEYDE